MAFQGDVAQIPLTNILQALTLNGQEGLLTVECPSFKRRLALLPGGLRPVNFDESSHDLLKLVLLKQNLITEPQFQNVFSTWSRNDGYPGDFLVRRRILTQELVENEIRNQVVNALLDIFLAPNLKYKFSARQDTQPYEFFSPDGLGELMVFNANSILMEAARREDEWARFRTEIPDEKEVFRVADRARLSVKDLGVPADSLKEVRPHLHGEKTVDGIFDATTLSHFEIYEVLFHLKKAGVIRSLALAEKRSLAEKLRRSLRLTEAVGIYESVLRNDPTDNDARQKLVGILEGFEDPPPVLVEHHMALARDAEDSDPSTSLAHLGKALAIDPANREAMVAFFEQGTAYGKGSEAITTLRRTLTCWKSAGRLTDCVDTLRELSTQFPDDVQLLQELAGAHHRAHDLVGAVDCLKKLATIYSTRRDSARLNRCLDKLAALSPDEAARFTPTTSRRRTRLRRSSRRRLAFVAAVAMFLATTASLAVLEYFSHVAFARLAKDVSTHSKYQHFDLAELTIREFESTFPLSLKRIDTKSMFQDLDVQRAAARQAAVKAREVEKKRSESLLVRAHIEATRDNYRQALKTLKSIDRTALNPERSRDFNTLWSKIRSYYATAEELRKKAKTARESDDIEMSHRLLKELLTRFPKAPSSEGLLLPIRIETTPPGAMLVVDGRELGLTPAVFDFAPSLSTSVILRKKGYDNYDLNRMTVGEGFLDPIEVSHVSVTLAKALAWRVKVDGPVECAPVSLGPHTYFGTRGGNVYCVNNDDGRELWRFSVPTKMDIAGGLELWNQILYFGCFDGQVYALNVTTGELAREPVPGCPAAHPIKEAPSAANANGVAAINCGGRSLSGYDVANGQIKWTLPIQTGRILGKPLSDKEQLYAVTTKGTVLRVNFDTGQIAATASLGIVPSYSVAFGRGRLFAADKKGKVVAFDLEEWDVVWSYETGSAPSGPPTADGKVVLVPHATGDITCLTTDGESKWRSRFENPIAAQGVLFRNTFFAGTTTGHTVSLDTWTGKIRWEFDTSTFSRKKPKALLSPGAISQGRFFIGSEDFSFYCFTLD